MDLPQSHFHKLSQLRANLEGFAAHHAASRGDGDATEAREFLKTLKALQHALVRRDYAAFRDADFRLHEMVILLADIPHLHECWLRVWNALADLHRVGFEECWPDLRVLSREHEHLVESIRLRDPVAAEDAARDHILAVWHRLAQMRGDTTELAPLERAEAFLAFRFSAPLTLGQVAARAAYTSPGNLSRLFKRRHGFGFQGYLQKLRLDKAAELLSVTRLPITQIARRVGYRDVSRFGQHFSRRFGLPPSQWRKAQTKQPLRP